MTADAAMDRVLVAGISGAGKTTLARRVGALLELPHHELDALHHGEGWQRRPEFEADVDAFSATERWITDGHYGSMLGEVLWERADTVLWVDMPRHVVMRRVIVRTFVRLLTRVELWNGNRERWRDIPRADHPIRWAWSQHARRRASIAAHVERHTHFRVVHLRSPREARAWIRGLEASVRPASPRST